MRTMPRMIQSEPAPALHRAPPAAFVLSWGVVALMVAASLAGLLVADLYPDGAWAREAFRGGDVATLVLAAPLLAGALILSARGSARAHVVWAGTLGYSVYNYAYYVLGAEFNDVFLLHIALLSASAWALILLVPSLDLDAIARRLRGAAAPWVGGLLVLVGLGQGGLWAFLLVRFAVTGEVLADIPVEGQHLVFALDLTLAVTALIVAGVLMLRRSVPGLVMGTAVCVFAAVIQVNLLLAGVFQDAAGVAGVKAFPLEGIVLTAAFLIASFWLLTGARNRA